MAASIGSPREEFARPPWAAGQRPVPHDPIPLRDQPHLPAGLAQPVERELIQTYARTALKAAPYHVVLTVAVAAMATALTPLATLLPGIVLTGLVVVVVAILARTFLAQEPSGDTIASWRRLFAIAEVMHATGWIMIVLPLIAHPAEGAHGTAAHGFALFVTVLVAIATAVLRAPLAAPVHAGLGTLSTVTAITLQHADGVEDFAGALLSFGALLFAVWLARRLRRTATLTLRMMAELNASFAELEQIKANTDEARRRAQAAERAKAQFLATMSHELRTPLNAILGFSEVMKNEVFGSHSTPSYRDYSKDIHGSGQHLLSLINEILDLSRIEAGQYALSEGRIRLADPVSESVALLQARIDAKRHQVRVVVDPALEPIVADGKAVRQILASLISNAVKFTPPGGEIAVKAGWTSRGGQYVSVRDNGPGIPEDELPVVLSSFGRGSLAHSAAEPGAGLGLSIVRGLAELHGGRFILKSRPRHGTEAIVVFPAGRTAQDDTRAAADPAAAA